MKKFDKNNKSLCNQFESIAWIDESGISEAELMAAIERFTKNEEGLSRAIQKAKTFAFIATRSRIAIDKDDIFQDKLFGNKLMAKQQRAIERQLVSQKLSQERAIVDTAIACGAYSASSDFGHTSPNSKLLLEIGFTGLLERVNQHAKKNGLTPKQLEFYESCKISLEAVLHVIRRLADAIRPYNEENSLALSNIAIGKPSNLYEAMQLLVIYFFLHEFIFGTRVRTLGRLDVLLFPFYKKDIESGVLTKEDAKEMIKFFFNKFWTAKVPYDLPFCLGGIDEDGNEVTGELSYLLVQTYNEMDIHSPKIHIRVSDKTPKEFVQLVLSCIRGGNSSFVFVNDRTVIQSLTQVGIDRRDANNYLPIGCYEPAVWGKEIGCTGNGGVNLVKAVELAITGGVDLISGTQVSIPTGNIRTYEDFLAAVKAHIQYLTEGGMRYIREIEKHYGEIGPDPLLSAMYDRSVETGVDVYEGGATYNNTSFYLYFIASLVDSVCAVKKLVFEQQLLTFPELCDVLKNNWKDHEKLRLIAKSIPEKYGNHNSVADEITKDLAEYCASIVNNQPNSRGGVFKAALFSTDIFVKYGQKTMATPDGRLAGEVLSKNLCATVGQDKHGITSLIHSATKIDHSLFPNGTVLDVILHPSAVSGEDGLEAFYTLLKTYMDKGGMALHGNVFRPEDLKKAQQDPETYKNLQVRVCGWNAYFVNLSKEEQDCFIRQAETTF
ncbi:MAG: hypothetical protein IKA05_06085 [Clostridia bacterium]|nr:hypothetical protein [Clostridia bacterium]